MAPRGRQLSAFWTKETGAVLLGRRGGTTKKENFDKLEDWRLWPLHAVSGCKPDGKVFTTARIRRPEVASESIDMNRVVRVAGTIPRAQLGQARALDGRLDYARSFTIGKKMLKVETSLKSTGQDTIAELYETLPVFLRESAQQPKMTPTTIEFRIGNDWAAAGPDWSEKVTAVRLKRFKGAVMITFDRARRIKLAATDWTDTYLSRASCRNVLIDLVENGGQPKVLRSASISP